MLAAGLLVVAVFSGGGAALASSTVTDCASQPCHGSTALSGRPAGTHPSSGEASCIRDASCGGGGALSVAAVAGLLLASIAAATGVIQLAPFLLRRIRSVHGALPPGVSLSLLHPPQSV